MSNQLLSLQVFTHEAGHSYLCRLPPDVFIGDTQERPVRSGVELFEGDRALGSAHSQHDRIRQQGRGLFSRWHNYLYFATSDNSDPRANGRRYSLYIPEQPTSTSDRQARLARLITQVSDAMPVADAYSLAEAIFYEVFPLGFIGDFGKVCWDDEAFVTDYLRLVPGNRRSFERKYVVSQLVMAIGHVRGDLAECGVYNGATAYFMARAAEMSGAPRRLHLFDSFEGLSPFYALLPVLLVFQIMAMIGVSYVLSAVGVYIRDTKDFIQVFLVIGVYLVPTFYLPTAVPTEFRVLLLLNPFSHMVWCFQDVLYYGRFEHPWSWPVFFITSVVTFVAGASVFRRLRVTFGNVL